LRTKFKKNFSVFDLILNKSKMEWETIKKYDPSRGFNLKTPYNSNYNEYFENKNENDSQKINYLHNHKKNQIKFEYSKKNLKDSENFLGFYKKKNCLTMRDSLY